MTKFIDNKYKSWHYWSHSSTTGEYKVKSQFHPKFTCEERGRERERIGGNSNKFLFNRTAMIRRLVIDRVIRSHWQCYTILFVVFVGCRVAVQWIKRTATKTKITFSTAIRAMKRLTIVFTCTKCLSFCLNVEEVEQNNDHRTIRQNNATPKKKHNTKDVER